MLGYHVIVMKFVICELEAYWLLSCDRERFFGGMLTLAVACVCDVFLYLVVFVMTLRPSVL